MCFAKYSRYISGNLVMTLDIEEKLNRLAAFHNNELGKYDTDQLMQKLRNKYYSLKVNYSLFTKLLTNKLSHLNNRRQFFQSANAGI